MFWCFVFCLLSFVFCPQHVVAEESQTPGDFEAKLVGFLAEMKRFRFFVCLISICYFWYFWISYKNNYDEPVHPQSSQHSAIPKPLVSKIRTVIVVGAQKCGTSAMAAYLSSHPQVAFSTVKET